MELLSGLFNFDTKLLRTLKDLFVPPGLVIREYNANRRASYVPPLRSYLFTSVLFFVLLTWTTSQGEGKVAEVVSIARDGDEDHVHNGLTLEFEGTKEMSDSVLRVLSERPMVTDAMLDSSLRAIGEEPSFANRLLVRLALNASANSPRKSEYVDRIFSVFSKLMFLLLPLFAFLLYLLHSRSGRYFTEHLVFALYYHTVVFICIGLRLLFGRMIDPGYLDPMVPIVLLIHLIWSMKTVYERAWISTLLRASALLVLYFVPVLIGFTIAALIGVF